MIQIYVKGPTPAGDWSGACEVSPDAMTYVYHSDWPRRNPYPITHRFGESLADLVARGHWQLLIDPCLILPEGL